MKKEKLPTLAELRRRVKPFGGSVYRVLLGPYGFPAYYIKWRDEDWELSHNESCIDIARFKRIAVTIIRGLEAGKHLC